MQRCKERFLFQGEIDGRHAYKCGSGELQARAFTDPRYSYIRNCSRSFAKIGRGTRRVSPTNSGHCIPFDFFMSFDIFLTSSKHVR